MKKIAVIVTNIDKYPQLERKTGLWLGEVTHFCDEIEKAGYSFDLISPLGGICPLDPQSLSSDKTNARFLNQTRFANQLHNTLAAKEVKAADYAAVYFSGGHGTMWDFPNSKELQALTAEIYQRGGVVSAVCHGVCGLLNVKVHGGEPLISNKEITGFSNFEEKIIRLAKHVPFLLEDAIVQRSGRYRRAFLPFMPYVVASDRLITGQNPASARKLGKVVASKL